ncbi:ABC transporter permease subunit [Pseudooceanicola sp. GBMRC 2024]|uniref:ABC transporter permease subunit n=2 Tax=Paracoccaceae TaxID=31989 RepID=A0A6L7G5K6_9RHOB|nr:ABC transporter permease subunit [Pseudooceanicola albus]
MARADQPAAAPGRGTDHSRAERMRRRRRIRTLEKLAAPVLGLVLLGIWELCVRVFDVSTFILPPPSAILLRLVSDWQLFLGQGVTTAIEISVGFAMAVLAGVIIALCIFYSRIVEVAVYPLLIALQTVPKVALAPLVVLYFGYGWGPKIFLAFLISFFAILVPTVVGLKELNPGFANLAKSMGASERQVFFKIRLPAALPNIFGGLKVGLTLSVIGAVIGEYVAAERGLGYLQLQANANFDTTLNFASVFAIALLGLAFYAILRLIEDLAMGKMR